MRSIFAATAAVATFAMAVPASADHHGENKDLATVLASDMRGEDGNRDKYRNPAETLKFFQVKPTHTVVEYGPGGGWYTRVLAPYVMAGGKYIAVNQDSDGRTYRTRAAEARSKGWTERFKTGLAEGMDIKADDVTAFELDETPDDAKGTADRVVIFRSMHGLSNANVADTVLRSLRDLLKDDGMVGVVQHRAPKTASWDDVNPAGGYMREADVVKIFELNGFELVKSSEINANPKDPANWEGGVWTLPPVLRYGDKDRAKYEAIGESDRMTLLFKKAM